MKLCPAEPWFCLQVVVWDPAVGDLHPWGLPIPWHPRGGAVLTATGGASDGPAPELPSRAVRPCPTLPHFPVLTLLSDLASGLTLGRDQHQLTVTATSLAQAQWGGPGSCALSSTPQDTPPLPHLLCPPTRGHEVLP